MKTKTRSKTRHPKGVHGKFSALQSELFPGFLREIRSGFGGAKTYKSHPTSARPFARNTPIHVVFRSDLAVKERSFLSKAREVEKLLGNESSRVGAKVLDCANGGNHIHVVLTFKSALAQKRFLRTFSARLSRLMLGAKKGSPQLLKSEKFFAGRPFTRIASWGKDLKILRAYLVAGVKTLNSATNTIARQQLKEFEQFGLICFAG